MMNNPKISVLMPAYNTEKYIAEAIESILNQTFKDFEFIIIDDCSIDRTWEIIQEYASKDDRIVALRNKKNLKLSGTLNKGIKIARGDYIARMDADDISFPNRLEKQLDFMEKHPEIGISGATMEIINEASSIIGKRKYHLTDSEIRKHIFKYSPFSHPLVIIRRSVLQKVGYYDPKYNPAEDYELYFRIGRCSKFGNLPDILLLYRIMPKSMTTGSTKKMELKTLAIRDRAVKEYGYKMTITDKLYWILQYFSVFIIPAPIKIWLFNQLRNS